MRKFILATCLLLVAFILWPGGEAVSQQVREVWIANFPSPQEIQGNVSIKEPIPSSKLFRREGIVVPPVPRHQTTSLISGGVIDTESFTHITLSLQGDVRGAQPREGHAGAVLVPDETPILRAFNEDSRFQFALEAIAPIIAAEGAWIHSDSETLELAFPRYRIYFYNTSNRTVELNLYGYLKN